ncbi:MAG: hypothetical protein QOG85_739 [Gaiellaceae bacterium]|jgi:hypothetical protein|nr:hypothetical protein [Gaiellaceae bacterium]
MSPLARLLAVLLALLGFHSAGSSGQAPSAGRVPSDVRSITIHNNAGVSVTVTEPADVAAIARWFDGLPHFVARPCPLLVRKPPWVRFEFRGPDASFLMRATDHLPGTCSGHVTYSDIGQAKYAPLADDGLVARVSKLLGLTFDPNRRTALNKVAAERDVTRLLEHIRVPAGSRLVAEGASKRCCDAHRTWKVHIDFEQVFAFEQEHRPRGSSVNGSGEGSLWGVVNERDLFLTFPAIPHRIVSREVDFHFSALPGGWTRFSADAGDEWVVARSPNEKVPAGVREIVIHGEKTAPGPGIRVVTTPFPRKLARRFTRPKQVARIVHWFDSLPVGAADPSGWCTLSIVPPAPPVLVIDFIAADGTKLATASGFEFPWACDDTIDFSVGGRDEAPLVVGNVLRRIERLPR